MALYLLNAFKKEKQMCCILLIPPCGAPRTTILPKLHSTVALLLQSSPILQCPDCLLIAPGSLAGRLIGKVTQSVWGFLFFSGSLAACNVTRTEVSISLSFGTLKRSSSISLKMLGNLWLKSNPWEKHIIFLPNIQVLLNTNDTNLCDFCIWLVLLCKVKKLISFTTICACGEGKGTEFQTVSVCKRGRGSNTSRVVCVHYARSAWLIWKLNFSSRPFARHILWNLSL